MEGIFGLAGGAIRKGTRTITASFDGGGSVLEVGATADVRVPFRGTITRWTMLADQSGSAVVDVRRSSFGDYPPTASICGTKPTLSSAAKGEDTDLEEWSRSFDANSCFRFVLQSVSTITRLALVLEVVE